ncbi:glycine--tRNA ligase subunit beta [Desulfolucanica intricata]|uniref:glycine--tRNA ligase subunit beta n=1 Tax=Desulfolucanica intricata TaxID=1285191 RepID=UPI000831ABB3|nr:glycine--tRNA ligase subunit beta [Desulfolucanica intricata]
MAKDFLLEIGTEEIPARFLNPALTELKELAIKALEENRLGCGRVNTYGTPRRLVLFVEELAEEQESLVKEVKGPAVKVAFTPEGEPSRAAMGFARSQQVEVNDLVRRMVGHVEYLFAVKREEGRTAYEVLTELCPTLITGLHFPRPMRWGDLDIRFARPIRWLLALWGNQVVDFEFAGLKSGKVSYGHRFLSGSFEVNNPKEYFTKMRSNYVIVDPSERKEVIWQQVQDLALKEGGRVGPDEELLEQVCNLLEYPTTLCGSFEEKYLRLPKEVLVTPMRGHQRYFPVLDREGKLLPRFIAVRNGTADHLDIVREGNEKVLRARLADAEFFFEEDLKIPLADKVDGLKKVVFQESLGTVYDKVERVIKLCSYLSHALGIDAETAGQTRRAAELCKADLVTNMVYEFTELQGVMGREYALKSGEDKAVAQAIYEHYLPRYAGDELPESVPGKTLSIADKLDTIVGCFGIGIQPTGSQDPYALRRQALGICNIIVAGGLTLSLKDMVTRAYNGYQEQVRLKLNLEEILSAIQEFFQLRLKGIFTEKGLSYDTIEAVLAAGFDDFSDTWKRAKALSEFRGEEAFGDLLTVFNRANNLAKNAQNTIINPELLEDPTEKELYNHFLNLKHRVEQEMLEKNYGGVLKAVAGVREALSKFFDSVMVMAENLKVRENRLALLKNLAELMRSVADFSKIVEDKKGV